MKRKMLCVGMCVATIMSTMLVSEAAVNLFSDDFDGYTAGKGLGSESNQTWTSRGGTVSEADEIRLNVACVADDSASEKRYIQTSLIDKKANEKVVYMWDYMTLEPTNDQRTVIWGVTENGEEKKAIQIRSYNVDGEWKLQYQNGSAWVDIGTLDAGKWYHFKVIEDYSSSKSELYVNYEEVFKNGTVMQTAAVSAPKHKITFGTNNVNGDLGTMYIDRVSINSLGDKATIFADDFDLYEKGKGLGGASGQVWVSKGGTVGEWNGSMIAKVTDDSTSNGMYIATPVKNTAVGETVFEWDYVTPQLTDNQRMIIFGVNENGEEKKVVQIRTFNQDGEWKLQYQNAAAWCDICNVKAEERYSFKISADFANGKLAMSVDGEEIFKDGGFMTSSSVGAVNQKITFGTNNANSDVGVMYIDNVKVYSGESYTNTPDLSNVSYYCMSDEEAPLKKITALENGEITVKAKLVNLSDSAVNAIVAAAIYKNGNLYDVDFHTSERHSNKSTCFDVDSVVNLYCNVTADISTEEADEWILKTFLLNSFGEMVPLTENIILN